MKATAFGRSSLCLPEKGPNSANSSIKLGFNESDARHARDQRFGFGSIRSASVELTAISRLSGSKRILNQCACGPGTYHPVAALYLQATEFREERDSPMRKVSGVTPADLPH